MRVRPIGIEGFIGEGNSFAVAYAFCQPPVYISKICIGFRHNGGGCQVVNPGTNEDNVSARDFVNVSAIDVAWGLMGLFNQPR
jgi:hypothetical protein